MSTEQFFLYLGYAVIILFIVWFLIKLTNVQVKIVEGLTNRNTANQTGPNGKVISNETAQIIDGLHLDKYRGNYEDIIMNLEKWCNTSIVAGIADNKINASDPLNPENIKHISALNQLKQFKDTLNDAMQFLDSQ